MTPNAGAKLLPMSELTETAIATLCREIGPVIRPDSSITSRQAWTTTTAERTQLPDKRSIDDVVAEIERRRSADK